MGCSLRAGPHSTTAAPGRTDSGDPLSDCLLSILASAFCRLPWKQPRNQIAYCLRPVGAVFPCTDGVSRLDCLSAISFYSLYTPMTSHLPNRCGTPWGASQSLPAPSRPLLAACGDVAGPGEATRPAPPLLGTFAWRGPQPESLAATWLDRHGTPMSPAMPGSRSDSLGESGSSPYIPTTPPDHHRWL